MMDASVCFSMGDLLRVQEVGFHTVNAVYTHPDRKLEWNVFILVTNGKLQIWEEKVKHILTRGQFLFLKSGLHHWGEPEAIAGTNWYWIHFYDSTGCPQYTEFNQYSSSSQIIPCEEYNKYFHLPKHGSVLKTQLIESKLDSMNQLFNTTDPFRTITLSIQAMDLFLDLYKESIAFGAASRTDRTVEKVIRLLEEKNTYALSSKEIAESLHVNYAYLCRVFKEKTGTTIRDYNTRVFVNKAVKMIRETSLNISEISEKLGFGSPFYFSRKFKIIVGCSPSDYGNKIYRNGL